MEGSGGEGKGRGSERGEGKEVKGRGFSKTRQLERNS